MTDYRRNKQKKKKRGPEMFFFTFYPPRVSTFLGTKILGISVGLFLLIFLFSSVSNNRRTPEPPHIIRILPLAHKLTARADHRAYEL